MKGVSASTVIGLYKRFAWCVTPGTDLLARYDDHHFVAISAGMGGMRQKPSHAK